MTTNSGEVPVGAHVPGGRCVSNRPELPTPTLTSLWRLDRSARRIDPGMGRAMLRPACMVDVPTMVPGSGAPEDRVPHAESTTAATETAPASAILASPVVPRVGSRGSRAQEFPLGRQPFTGLGAPRLVSGTQSRIRPDPGLEEPAASDPRPPVQASSGRPSIAAWFRQQGLPSSTLCDRGSYGSWAFS